ncbi:polymeric immunoglobulin receptor-like, partial [Channa argus]|uniref:polymeric immunoglobulin receptor-like n=1 Tax=Channa argus TaxID=215402 RepID=UPI0035230AA1
SDALTPVISVQLGEPVTFTCDLPNAEITRREVHWYRQSAGDTMKLVVILRKSTKPEFSKGFPESRMKVDDDNSFSNLTILRTIEEDEGMYQCAVIEWMTIPVWSGTYLLIKGNSQRTSNYTVVQWSTASDPVRPGDSVTLQCSLLSDSENKKCPGDHSVYWFRAGSEKSHPEIIHTDGNHQCEKRSDTVKSCVYGFSKTISSSDAGTYYCAVATCGQILFGNGTKLQIEDALTPVISVQLGEPVTFTCDLPNAEITRREVHWYRQSAGDTMKLVVILRKSTKPEFSKGFPESRMKVDDDNSFSNLTILRTIEEDEGMYQCAVIEWMTIPVWSGTYLLIKGNSQRTSNYTVVQWSTASDPVRPGDSVTLQCSLLSDSENKTCPGDHSVYWFRAGSEKSHPEIIHTDGNHQCEKRSDTVKSCVYGFSKTISSSDAGTYYCAVATCGQILFGNGTKLDIKDTNMWIQMTTAVIFLLSGVSTMIFLAFLFCPIKCDKNAAVSLHKYSKCQKTQQEKDDTQVYSAVIFTTIKTASGGITNAKAANRARIYAAAKAFGLN